MRFDCKCFEIHIRSVKCSMRSIWKWLVLHLAACAIHGCRVGAYAIGYHGNSWHSRCSELTILLGRPMDHYWVSFIALSCRSFLRHILTHSVSWNHDSWIQCVVTIGSHLSLRHLEDFWDTLWSILLTGTMIPGSTAWSLLALTYYAITGKAFETHSDP